MYKGCSRSCVNREPSLTEQIAAKRLTGDLEADVLIVGAGTAGIPAAIAAARTGARVVLLEEDPVPGGAPVDSFVLMPCGGPVTGIYGEMVGRLVRNHSLWGRASSPAKKRYDWFLPEAYLSVIYSLITDEPNIHLICGAHVERTIVRSVGGRPRVDGIILTVPGQGERRISARVTVDATGTGEVAVQAGCTVMFGREAQATFGELHAPPVADGMVQQCSWMYLSQKLGLGPALDMMRLPYRPGAMIDPDWGMWRNAPSSCQGQDRGLYLHWGSIVRCSDTSDPEAVAAAQQQALLAMQPDIRELRQHGYLVHLAPRLGIRESRRIVGEHIITEADLRQGSLPDDTVAVGTYNLDLSGEVIADRDRALPTFGIPYPALVPKGVDGLLLAGRALSGSHVALGAYRVQPILASAGQAAGVAASLCGGGGMQPRDVDVWRLRALLQGAGQGVELSSNPSGLAGKA
jgi:hypothetical protein